MALSIEVHRDVLATVSRSPNHMKSLLVYTEAIGYLKEEWLELAKKYNHNLVIACPTNHAELLECIAKNDVDVIVDTLRTARRIGGYPREVIDQMKGVKAVIHLGAGYECLGNPYDWKDNGIELANSPAHVASSTANAAVFLTFAAMRNFYRLTTSLRANEWQGTLNRHDCHDPDGHTLTIVGMGSIGTKIKDRLLPFGFDKIQYCNRRPASAEDASGAEYVDLETTWKTSDVIIFSCPYNSSTHHLLNKNTITKCKDGVVIVNISRGGVIDEQALVDGLGSGKIASAGLDVYEHEPQVHPDLIANKNIFLTPHSSAFTVETRQNGERELMANIESVWTTGHVINLIPELR